MTVHIEKSEESTKGEKKKERKKFGSVNKFS